MEENNLIEKFIRCLLTDAEMALGLEW